jgi:hypothetical protein
MQKMQRQKPALEEARNRKVSSLSLLSICFHKNQMLASAFLDSYPHYVTKSGFNNVFQSAIF